MKTDGLRAGVAFAFALIASGCTGYLETESVPAAQQPVEDPPPPLPEPTPPTPEADPPPPPLPAAPIEAAIASAQLLEDCPDGGSLIPSPPPAAEAPAEPAQPAAQSTRKMAVDSGVALGDSARGFAPMCTQSYMQLSLRAPADAIAQRVRVVQVKVIAQSGASSIITARQPQRWSDSVYVPWDESIAPGESIQSSYKLSAPDWTTLGGGNEAATYGLPLTLEVELEIGGVVRTLRSPQIAREFPARVVT